MTNKNPLLLTPRQKQLKFRRELKETCGWALLAAVPYLMILHWIVAGY